MFVDFHAVKQHLSAGGLIKLQQRAADCGLPAAGFADQTQSFPLADGKRHVVHGLQGDSLEKAYLDGKILFQVPDL